MDTLLLDNICSLKEAGAKHIIANPSSSNVIISVGESLLLFIDAGQKAGVPKDIINKLKVLYLEGIKTESDAAFLQLVKQHLADSKQLTVSFDPKVIDEDPSRRFFETHLAYRLMEPSAKKLDLKKLQTFTQELKDNLYKNINVQRKACVEFILDGVQHESLNKYQLEYAELIGKLKSHDFYGLSAIACDNLCEIAKSSVLATLNTQNDPKVPANIYKDSIFTMGIDGRGRRLKKGNTLVRTSAKGLMRSYTPLPDDGIVSERFFSPFQRSADQASYMIGSQWNQHAFARGTHIVN